MVCQQQLNGLKNPREIIHSLDRLLLLSCMGPSGRPHGREHTGALTQSALKLQGVMLAEDPPQAAHK